MQRSDTGSVSAANREQYIFEASLCLRYDEINVEKEIVLGSRRPRELLIAGSNRLLLTNVTLTLYIDAFLEELHVSVLRPDCGFQGAIAGQMWIQHGLCLERQGSTQRKRPLWKVIDVSEIFLIVDVSANVRSLKTVVRRHATPPNACQQASTSRTKT